MKKEKYPYSFSFVPLGVGSALPSLRFRHSAQFVQVHTDRILIDCGESVQHGLLRNNISIFKVNVICISHLHGDHFFGIFGLLTTLSLMGRQEPLLIFGPKKLEPLLSTVLSTKEKSLSYEIKFTPINIEGKKTKLWETKYAEIFAFPLYHGIECYGYQIKEKPHKRKILIEKLEERTYDVRMLPLLKEGKDILDTFGKKILSEDVTLPPLPQRAFSYCSDTAYHKNIPACVFESDYLYHEATFNEKEKKRAQETNHSTAKDAAKVATEAKAKKLLIGHFSSKIIHHKALLKEAQEVFLNTEIACENERYEISD